MFALSFAIGTMMINGAFGWISLLDAFLLIIFSISLGVLAALINTALEKMLTKSKGMETIVRLGLILIVYSLSEHWKLEPLLSTMVMGTVMVNTFRGFDIMEKEIDNHLADIIFMLFFYSFGYAPAL